jgi:ATP-dependent exoDNAse (exonuclease V) beta subunit
MNKGSEYDAVTMKMKSLVEPQLWSEFFHTWSSIPNKIQMDELWKLAFDEVAQPFPEIEIIDEQGQLKRIDRLIKKDDQWHLFEFKTGDPRPEHQKQLEFYQKTLDQCQIQVKTAEILYV